MATPTYSAKKVGDSYVIQRSDPPAKIGRSLLIAGGGAVVMYGLLRRGICGGVAALVGSGAAYAGMTGRWPWESLAESLSALWCQGDEHDTPSHQHDYAPKAAAQVPQDEVDESAMESFPASDAPARQTPSKTPSVVGRVE